MAENDPTPFQYDDLAQDQIRLLHLQPSKVFSSPLRGTITHGSTTETYSALSYVWGEDTPSKAMRIGDQDTLPLTASLDSALRHLRPRKRKLTLWVDQLCINQSDKRDVESQVRMMAEIYTKSAQCLVWLGEADADEKSLFAFVGRFLVLFRGLQRALPRNEWGFRHLSTFLPTLAKLLPGINSLPKNPWFSRMWTYQEFVLSPRVSFVCGSWSVPAKMLKDVLFDDPSLTSTAGSRFLAHDMLALNMFQQEDQDFGLVYMMLSMKHSASRYERDNVVGALGIMQAFGMDTSSAPLSRPSVVEMFVWSTRQWIKHSASISCLALAKTSHTTPGLPSWTIDWAARPHEDIILTVTSYVPTHGGALPTATKGSAYTPSEAPQLPHQLLLVLRGRIVDGVSMQHRRLHPTDSEHGQPTAPGEQNLSQGQYSLLHMVHRLDFFCRLMATEASSPKLVGPCAQDLQRFKALYKWHGPSKFRERANQEIELETLVMKEPLLHRTSTEQAGFCAILASSRMPGISRYVSELGARAMLPALMVLGFGIEDDTAFVTARGRLGLYPEKIMGPLSDKAKIALICGSDIPVILEPLSEDEGSNEYKFGGFATVEGMTEGEMWPENLDESTLDTFVIK